MAPHFHTWMLILIMKISSSEEKPFPPSVQQMPLHPHLQVILDDMAYSPWTTWSNCSVRFCTQFRVKRCRGVFMHQMGLCRSEMLIQKRFCCKLNQTKPIDVPSVSQNFIKDKNEAGTNSQSTINIPKRRNMTSMNQSTYFPDEKCGIRKQTDLLQSLRILGGQATQPNSWPWMVSIFDTRSDMYFCGGTLIHPRFVLTAAHCVLHFNPQFHRFTNWRRRNLGMRVGDHVRGHTESTQKLLRPRRILYHRKFNPNSVTYDVALVELEESVLRSPGVDYACLPTPEQVFSENTMCIVTGWGSTEQDSQPARTLQEARVYLTSNKKCQQHYAHRRLFPHIHLCAGARGRDTCKGDSGGPLLCPVTDGFQGNRWIIYGITSFGPMEGCGHTNGVYQRVTAVTEWIQRVINRYSATYH